jgi:hypothetical protein
LGRGRAAMIKAIRPDARVRARIGRAEAVGCAEAVWCAEAVGCAESARHTHMEP